jgi:hypothetical protein
MSETKLVCHEADCPALEHGRMVIVSEKTASGLIVPTRKDACTCRGAERLAELELRLENFRSTESHCSEGWRREQEEREKQQARAERAESELVAARAEARKLHCPCCVEKDAEIERLREALDSLVCHHDLTKPGVDLRDHTYGEMEACAIRDALASKEKE